MQHDEDNQLVKLALHVYVAMKNQRVVTSK